MEALNIRKALIHGATLSSVLQSLVAGKRQCDGLLFGSFRTQLQQNFHDDEPGSRQQEMRLPGAACMHEREHASMQPDLCGGEAAGRHQHRVTMHAWRRLAHACVCAHYHAEAITTEEHQACISSAVCCATTCSFYNEAGDINGEGRTGILSCFTPCMRASTRPCIPASLLSRLSCMASLAGTHACTSHAEQELQALLPPAGSTQEPMIGWISYRPGPRLHASMREAAVTSALYLRSVQAQASAHMHQQGQRPPGQEASPLRMPPMLFMVVTSNTAEHNGATLTLEYR
jgi:hypothetical protein